VEVRYIPFIHMLDELYVKKIGVGKLWDDFKKNQKELKKWLNVMMNFVKKLLP